MKVVLVSSFEDRFLEQDTLPELARRGVEVVARFEAKDCRSYDFESFRQQGVTCILHMTEVGPHSASESLSRLARTAGIPIRAMSRKKASWTFLPPPLDGGPASMKPEAALAKEPVVERRRGIGLHGNSLNIATGAVAAYEETRTERTLLAIGEGYLHASLDSDVPIPPYVEQYLRKTRFDRKEARLRDVIQLIIGHNIREPDHVLRCVLSGRDAGVFPRLMRVSKEEIEKRVPSLLAHELEPGAPRVTHIRVDERDKERLASIGLTDPNLVTRESVAEISAKVREEEKKMQNEAKVLPMTTGKSLNPHVASAQAVNAEHRSELDRLRAKVEEYNAVLEEMRPELEAYQKLKEVHAALRTLIKVKMMTPLEAAEKLFGEPLE